MNENSIAVRTRVGVNKVKAAAAAVSAGVMSMVISGAAFAQATGFADGLDTEFTATKPQLYAIGALVVTACGVVFLIHRGRKAAG